MQETFIGLITVVIYYNIQRQQSNSESRTSTTSKLHSEIEIYIGIFAKKGRTVLKHDVASIETEQAASRKVQGYPAEVQI